MKRFMEPAKELPVYGEYDTVVVGGGFAGVAAALAAARGGNRVLLCERIYVMDTTDVHKRFHDSVGLFGNWKGSGRGEAYELPYSVLYGKKIKNLVVAGRCISVTDPMWDITRVIPVCSVPGEAAGTAAALSKNFAEIDICKLHEKLQRNGVKLHMDE